jgi:hypothetical protein
MKNKATVLYFVVPIVLVLIFIPIFWRFNSTYEAKEAQRAEVIHQKKVEAIAEQDRQRQKAIDESLVTQARRQKEKKERDDRLQKERDEREAAVQARNKSANDSQGLKNRIDRLTRDVEAVKADIAKLEADEVKQRQEADGSKQYVVLAEANVKNLSQVLDRIQAADAAAEAAAKAAAAAKKS